MKIGMVSDSLGSLGFHEMLDTAKRLGVEGIEINAANWTAAAHCDLAALLKSEVKRKEFLRAFDERGLKLIALNANGNQLHPTDGARQSKGLYDIPRLLENPKDWLR
jgi:sugar phosphate isomerase/epimerase